MAHLFHKASYGVFSLLPVTYPDKGKDDIHPEGLLSWKRLLRHPRRRVGEWHYVICISYEHEYIFDPDPSLPSSFTDTCPLT